MKINICAETIEQAGAAANFANIDTLYLDIRYFGTEALRETAENLRASGIKAGLRLPGISRKKGRNYLFSIADKIDDVGFDSFIFGNIEDIILFHEMGLLRNRMFSTDHFIYCFNKKAEEMLISMMEKLDLKDSFKSICCPLELSIRELAAVGYDIDTELVVYGRAPMMTSAQCVKNTVQAVGKDSKQFIGTDTQRVKITPNGCDHKEELLYLKDRTGSLMPVKNACEFCMNTIYNSVPTVLFDLEAEIKSFSPDYIRYEFTIENGKEVKNILNSKIPDVYTRGHAKRKIE